MSKVRQFRSRIFVGLLFLFSCFKLFFQQAQAEAKPSDQPVAVPPAVLMIGPSGAAKGDSSTEVSNQALMYKVVLEPPIICVDCCQSDCSCGSCSCSCAGNCNSSCC